MALRFCSSHRIMVIVNYLLNSDAKVVIAIGNMILVGQQNVQYLLASWVYVDR
jgi:hypothetical protein